MREFLTHPLFNITLGCSVILWVGLAIATRISKTPARAHGALVLALVGAVLFPIFYLSVCWADWGLLEPLPEDLTFTSLTRLDSDVKPQEGFLVPVQPAPEKSALLSSPGPSVNTPPEVLIAGPLSPEIPSPSEALVPARSFPEKRSLRHWANDLLSWRGFLPFALGSLWLFLGFWCFLTVVSLVGLIRSLFATYSLAGADKNYQEASPAIRKLAKEIGLTWVPKLVEHSGIKTPAVAWPVGSWPVILIPKGAELGWYSDGVFLHELAHLKRLDHCWCAFANLTIALFPWNPFAYRARKNLLRFAEMASDDWAVACGANPTALAGELVELADSQAPPFPSILPVAYTETDLTDRVQRLCSAQSASPLLGSIRLILGGTGLMAALMGISFLQPVRGNLSRDFSLLSPGQRSTSSLQERSLEVYPATETMTIRVGDQGGPALNANVWVEILDREQFCFLGPIRTNENGEASFSVFADKVQAVFARNEQGRYGWRAWLPVPKSKGAFYVELQEPTSLKMQFLHAGQPVEGIEAELSGVEQLDYFGRISRLPAGFPRASGISNQNGELELRPVFPSSRNCVRVLGGKFPTYQIRSVPQGVTTVHLEQPGILEVHFQGEGKPPSLEQLSWSLIGQNRGKWQEIGQILNHSPVAKNPNLSGNQIRNLAPGLHSLSFLNGGATPFALEGRSEIVIKPGQITHVNLPFHQPASIQGRLVDAITGKGIPRIQLAVMAKKNGETVPFHQEVIQSDEAGNYQCFVKGGDDYTVAFLDHLHDSARYQYKYPQELTTELGLPLRPKPGEVIHLPDLALTPSVVFRGGFQVVDPKEGKQALELYCPVKPSPNLDYMANFRVAGNQFEIHGVPPAIPLKIRVRLGSAVNVPSLVETDAQGRAGNLVLDEKFGVTLRGQVQNPAGSPIPDARVKLFWIFPVQGQAGKLYSRRLMEATRTDAEGRYQFAGYWAGDEYFVEVEAQGHKPLVGNYNARYSGKPGQILDRGIQALTPVSE